MGHAHKNKNLPNCLNCHYPLAEFDSFCPNCGQKKTDGKTDMHELMHEFIHMWLHFDGKFIATLKHLFIPAKLTIEFFRGHHKRYAHPVQLYFLLGALYLFANAIANKAAYSSTEMMTDGFLMTAHRHIFLGKLDSVLAENLETKNLSKPLKDSVLAQTEKRMRSWEASRVERKAPKVDTAGFSFKLGKNIAISQNKSKDKKNTEGGKKDKNEASQITQMVKYFGFDSIDPVDLTLMDEDELMDKYQPKGQLQKYFLRQSQHFFQDGGSFMDKFTKYMFWASIVTLPLSGLLLLWMYRRRKDSYYVEHLVFLLHFSASSFLFYSIVFLTAALIPDSSLKSIVSGVAIILVYPFLLFAMKRYYKQGWGKTFLKFLIYSILSFTIGIIGTLVALALTVALL